MCSFSFKVSKKIINKNKTKNVVQYYEQKLYKGSEDTSLKGRVNDKLVFCRSENLVFKCVANTYKESNINAFEAK